MKPKPFDLEKAKAGAPVVCERHPSRHHVPARILCFDALGQNPIVALVTNEGDEDTETTVRLNLSGISAYHTLFMAPVKRTAWIVCRPIPIGNGNYNAEMGYTVLFETEEKARDALDGLWACSRYQIAKVEWIE